MLFPNPTLVLETTRTSAPVSLLAMAALRAAPPPPITNTSQLRVWDLKLVIFPLERMGTATEGLSLNSGTYSERHKQVVMGGAGRYSLRAATPPTGEANAPNDVKHGKAGTKANKGRSPRGLLGATVSLACRPRTSGVYWLRPGRAPSCSPP